MARQRTRRAEAVNDEEQRGTDARAAPKGGSESDTRAGAANDDEGSQTNGQDPHKHGGRHRGPRDRTLHHTHRGRSAAPTYPPIGEL